MNRSGLTRSQRLKSMIPLIVSLTALFTYLCVINWGRTFVVHYTPGKVQVL
jgi:hypothetical protein